MEKKESVSKKASLKKALKITGDVLLYLVIVLALFVLVVSITSKKDEDGTATVFGKQLRFVQSNSMAECDLTDVSGYKIKSIPVKSCVFIEVAPENETEKAEWYKNLKVGDVLTFKYVYTKQETITHRIVDIQENEGGGYTITLEGDNKNADSDVLKQTIDTSETDSPNYVIGKVTGQSYLLGLLVYAFKTPVGIICLIIIPCLIIIAFEVMRLIRVSGKDKKEKIKAEQEKQANEIEELKRQLAALQSNAANEQEQTEMTEKKPRKQTKAGTSGRTSQSGTRRKTTARAGTRKKTTVTNKSSAAESAQEQMETTAEKPRKQTKAGMSGKTSQSGTRRKTTARAGTDTRKKVSATAATEKEEKTKTEKSSDGNDVK